MPDTYKTKQGDMLDWICWMHYGQRRRLEDAAKQLGIFASESNSSSLVDGIQALSAMSTADLRGIVEKVLNANPKLVEYGPVLPAGVTITLPDLSPEAEDNEIIQLWDD